MGAARNKDAAKTATNGNLAFITYPPYCCETFSITEPIGGKT